MPIDPSIIFQAQAPQVMDPITAQAKRLQLSDLMGKQQLQQFDLQDRQRQQQEYQTLADLYQSTGGDPAAIRAGMAQRGLGAKIPGFDKAQADLQKTQFEAQEKQLAAAKMKIDATGAALSSLLANPQVDHQTVIGSITNLVQQGIVSPEQGQQMVRDLPGKVEQLRPYLMQQGLRVMDASKRLDMLTPKTQMQNMGGAEQAFRTNQLTGEVTPGQSFAKTATPGELLSAETARRGQNLADTRAAQTIDQGKIPPGYRRTESGDLQAIPGGPADVKLQGQLNADTQALTGSIASFDRLAAAANEVLKHPGLPGITGLSGKVPNFPGSKAADAEALLGTLKSQVGFGVLQDMRNNSKTGGALGSVSDAEGKRLEANLAALDRSQSLEQYKTNLQKIVDYADKAKDRVREAYNLKHGSQAGGATSAAPSLPQTNAKGWVLHVDANGNRAYVSPDGKQFEEAK